MKGNDSGRIKMATIPKYFSIELNTYKCLVCGKRFVEKDEGIIYCDLYDHLVYEDEISLKEDEIQSL